MKGIENTSRFQDFETLQRNDRARNKRKEKIKKERDEEHDDFQNALREREKILEELTALKEGEEEESDGEKEGDDKETRKKRNRRNGN